MANEPTALVSEYKATDTEIAFLTERRGIAFRAQEYRTPTQRALAADTSDFAKWLRMHASGTPLDVEFAPVLALHSHDFWFPLALLASDVSVQVYLGIVANYLYDRLKGALRHDKHTVHLSVVYSDTTAGRYKRFDYTGSVEGLRACVKKADLTNMMQD